MERTIQTGENGKSSSSGWINGNPYRVNAREGFATHSIPPGTACPEAHVTCPHPDPALRRLGWRFAFVFFLLGCWACALVAAVPWETILQR